MYKSKVSINKFEASNIFDYNAISQDSCTTELTLFLLGKVRLFKTTS